MFDSKKKSVGYPPSLLVFSALLAGSHLWREETFFGYIEILERVSVW